MRRRRGQAIQGQHKETECDEKKQKPNQERLPSPERTKGKGEGKGKEEQKERNEPEMRHLAFCSVRSVR